MNAEKEGRKEGRRGKRRVERREWGREEEVVDEGGEKGEGMEDCHSNMSGTIPPSDKFLDFVREKSRVQHLIHKVVFQRLLSFEGVPCC